ncbi:MAG: prephenate dehydratase [Candidatus Aureabacteria bacterium]|nr:prephenate dehydratase [Candidatus Auribacterota bacterium]
MTIDDIRKKIDAIDKKLVELMNSRSSLVHKIGKIKRKAKKEIYVPEREEAVYRKLEELSKGPLSIESLRAIYREIMSASLALEKELAIAYLGPEATFSHVAAREKFGSSVRYSPAPTIEDVFSQVERGEADYGVVPIENSIEGAVTYTLDMFIDSKSKICAEIYLDIAHCLLSNCERDLVSKIYSVPQVFGQCRSWIRSNFPAAELVEVSSTAKAAGLAAREGKAAAIANELAAEIYGVKVLERNIEDSGRNETRFLVIGKSSAGRTGNDKTSLLVSVADRVGALYQMLYPFRKNGINLTKIESRPSKKKAWEYYFFIDFAGHIEDRKAVKALKELRKQCLFVEHLGSYPKAR